MKQTAIALTFVLAAGTALLVASFFPPHGEQVAESDAAFTRESRSVSEIPGASESTGTALSHVTDRSAREARIDELIERRFIPAEYRELWLDPNYEQIAEAQFNVIPKLRRAPGEPCEPLGVEGSHLCWNDYDHHPYLAYELDQLRAMAETDAAAAEAVAIRLHMENESERLHYAMLASRLSGKSGPIMRFVYLYTPSQADPAYFDKMLDTYALALYGERMGYPYRYSVELEAKIMQDFDLNRAELYESLDQRRVKLLEGRG